MGAGHNWRRRCAWPILRDAFLRSAKKAPQDEGGVESPRGTIPMKIATIEPIAVALPMKKPVYMAGVEIRQADNVLVRIESDTGTVGWGEAASAPTMTGETVESMMAAIAYLLPAVLGRDPADIAGASAAMNGRMYANQAAKAAVEIALHDLVGRATGRPAYALLGGKVRSCIPVLGVV